MRYFLCTWSAPDGPDLPDWWMNEVADDGAVPRQINHLLNGQMEYQSAAEEGIVSVVHGGVDDDWFECDDPDMGLTEITRERFEEVWAQRPSRGM